MGGRPSDGSDKSIQQSKGQLGRGGYSARLSRCKSLNGRDNQSNTADVYHLSATASKLAPRGGECCANNINKPRTRHVGMAWQPHD